MQTPKSGNYIFMKVLFWNVKKKHEFIIDLILFKKPDLVFLSECDKSFLEDNNQLFSEIGYEYFENPGCERIRIIKRVDFDCEVAIQDTYYSSIYIEKLSMFVVSVHLPSQLRNHSDGLKTSIRNLRKDLDELLGDSNEKRIMIIGDFNVNPFEKPMINWDGFAATNSINSRKSVKLQKTIKSTYYNLTWQLYSRQHFPGTHHYNRPSGFSHDILDIHYLDQVLISQKIVNDYTSPFLEVIEKTNNHNYYIEGRKKLVVSDHLPLFCEIKKLKYEMEKI